MDSEHDTLSAAGSVDGHSDTTASQRTDTPTDTPAGIENPAFDSSSEEKTKSQDSLELDEMPKIIPADKEEKSGKLNDHCYVSVNEHKKNIRGEKLYVTKDKRRKRTCRRILCAAIAAVLIVAAVTIAALVGVGIIDPQPQLRQKDGRSRDVDTPITAGVFQNGVDSNQLDDQEQFENFPPGFLRNAYELSFRMTNLGWDPALADNTSSMYQDLSHKLTEGLRDLLVEDKMADFHFRSKGFRPGSVVADIRIGWTNEAIFLSQRDIIRTIEEEISGNQGILFGIYEVDPHSISTDYVPDNCRFLGCSHECSYSYKEDNFFCECPMELTLDTDDRMCREPQDVLPEIQSFTTEKPNATPQAISTTEDTTPSRVPLPPISINVETSVKVTSERPNESSTMSPTTTVTSSSTTTTSSTSTSTTDSPTTTSFSTVPPTTSTTTTKTTTTSTSSTTVSVTEEEQHESIKEDVNVEVIPEQSINPQVRTEADTTTSMPSTSSPSTSTTTMRSKETMVVLPAEPEQATVIVGNVMESEETNATEIPENNLVDDGSDERNDSVGDEIEQEMVEKFQEVEDSENEHVEIGTQDSDDDSIENVTTEVAVDDEKIAEIVLETKQKVLSDEIVEADDNVLTTESTEQEMVPITLVENVPKKMQEEIATEKDIQEDESFIAQEVEQTEVVPEEQTATEEVVPERKTVEEVVAEEQSTSVQFPDDKIVTEIVETEDPVVAEEVKPKEQSTLDDVELKEEITKSKAQPEEQVVAEVVEPKETITIEVAPEEEIDTTEDNAPEKEIAMEEEETTQEILSEESMEEPKSIITKPILLIPGFEKVETEEESFETTSSDEEVVATTEDVRATSLMHLLLPGFGGPTTTPKSEDSVEIKLPVDVVPEDFEKALEDAIKKVVDEVSAENPTGAVDVPEESDESSIAINIPFADDRNATQIEEKIRDVIADVTKEFEATSTEALSPETTEAASTSTTTTSTTIASASTPTTTTTATTTATTTTSPAESAPATDEENEILLESPRSFDSVAPAINSVVQETSKSTTETPEDVKATSCKGDEFQCDNKSCISVYARCNGIPECDNGADEENCESTECPSTTDFRCSSGQCLRSDLRCDGNPDCSTGEDEWNCAETCEEFMCTEGRCIPDRFRCDGHSDCAGGEDEAGCSCKEDEFRCVIGGGCLMSAKVCDGRADCQDGSDEWECVASGQDGAVLIRTYNGTLAHTCTDGWTDVQSASFCSRLGLGSPNSISNITLDNSEYLFVTNSTTDVLPETEGKECSTGTVAIAVECSTFGCGQWNISDDLSSSLVTEGSIELESVDQWPSVAYLVDVRKKESCTVSIVSPSYMLSSYSCIKAKSLDPLTWVAFVGPSLTPGSPKAQIKIVDSIIPHPSFKTLRGVNSNDVALIRVTDPIKFSDSVKPICLAEEEAQPGQLCVKAGWSNVAQGVTFRQYIDYVPNARLPDSICNSEQHYNGILGDESFCSGFPAEKPTCKNDMGSPLMCLTPTGSWQLYGLLSRDGECHLGSHPDTFISAVDARDWILNTIKTRK